jgi:hypothetical protein
MFAARAAAVREVGEHAIAAFPVFVFGGILGQGFAASWAAEFDSRLESFRAPRAPRPAATAKTEAAARPKKPASLQHPIGLNSGVEIPPKLFGAKRAPDDEAPLKPGQVRVKVLRHGYSPADDRPQCHFGQLIQLPRTTAERVAAAGVVEIIESQELRP